MSAPAGVTPEFAVHIMEDGSRIGATDATGDHKEAQRTLRQIERAYPDSVLVMRHHQGVWLPADERTVQRIAYQHTYDVLGVILGEGLPLLSWDLKAYASDALRGSYHGAGEQDARDAFADYAALFKADVVEKDSDGALQLTLEAAWQGVDITISAYVAARVRQIAGAA